MLCLNLPKHSEVKHVHSHKQLLLKYDSCHHIRRVSDMMAHNRNQHLSAKRNRTHTYYVSTCAKTCVGGCYAHDLILNGQLSMKH